MRKTIAEVAREYLLETGGTILSWGNLDGLHEVATRAGLKWKHPADATIAVLDGLARRPDLFRKFYRNIVVGRRNEREGKTRCFALIEVEDANRS